MNEFRKLNERTWVSPQISGADVAQAQSLGVTVIVNNRPEGEAPDQTPGHQIEAAATAAGLAYVAIPITHSGFSAPQIAAMGEVIARGEPMLAYCRSGTRSTLLWALAQAQRGGEPEALAKAAAEAGYSLDAIRPMMDMVRPR